MSKTPLHLHHRAADLVANTGFAAMLLHGRRSVVGISLRRHWTSAAVAVVAYSARVRLGRLGYSLCASDGILAALCVDFGWLLLDSRSLSQAIHDAWFAFVCWACANHGFLRYTLVF
jgi:hypothetical protein